MRLGASWKVVAAILLCCAALTGCSGESEPPPLAEATKTLVSDGDAVVAWIEPSLTGLTKERADDRSGTSACGPDKEQRVYTAKGNFANPSKESPVNLLGILKTELLGRGYHTEVVNNLDLSEDDTSVVVVINPDVRLTFVLFARLDATPNLVIVGKTECYSRAG